nr:choline/ethanolamine kinase family protein [uncultured Draconibacterium sp.]
MDITEIINQIPKWKDNANIRYEPLTGGYSNIVYKVFVDGENYALRINGKQNKFLELNYDDEIEIINLASKDNLTPKVLECENKTDFLITEFIDGNVLSEDQVANPDILKKVVDLVKRIHKIPYQGNRHSTQFSLTRNYLRGAKKLGVLYPTELNEFIKRMDVIEKNHQKDPNYLKYYCHNDVFAHNILLCPDGDLKILDWELSGLGDIWFDLATISFSCGFDQATDESLLNFYFGNSGEQKMKTLHDIKWVCMIREIGWALLHTALNKNKPEPGTDYSEFANSILNRLKQGLVTLI